MQMIEKYEIQIEWIPGIFDPIKEVNRIRL